MSKMMLYPILPLGCIIPVVKGFLFAEQTGSFGLLFRNYFNGEHCLCTRFLTCEKG